MGHDTALRITLPPGLADPDPVAVEALRHAAEHAAPLFTLDPLQRLLDPTFTEQSFFYEHSRLETFDLPGSPHTKQWDFLESERRFRWLFWANQSGKTSIGAVEAVLLALGRHPFHQLWEPPIHGWASALTWELWENILLPELLTWIPLERIISAPEPFQQGGRRTIKIRADNGSISTITGKSAEQGAGRYQSARRHFVWFDEEHPISIYREVLPRLLRFGGILWGTMTPLKGLSWIYRDIYVPWKRGKSKEHFCSHCGVAENPGIPPEHIESLKDEYAGNPAQLNARLYGLFTQPTGIALREYDPERNLETGELRAAILEQGWPLWAGVDFGSWRFAFVLAASDRAGRLHVVEELFSQKETLEARGKKVHDILWSYGARDRQDVRILGDAANPTDIVELNEAFKRIGSKFRVGAVEMDNKLRAAGVERLNNLLSRGALLIRRSIGEYQSWRLGQSAASEGKVVVGSRLLYEVTTWRYPEPSEIKGVEEAQKQDPDDNTADGADMMAALRYLVMSWWKKARVEMPDEEPRANVDTGLEEMLERIAEEKAPTAQQRREAAEFNAMIEEGRKLAAGKNVDAGRTLRGKKPPRAF